MPACPSRRGPWRRRILPDARRASRCVSGCLGVRLGCLSVCGKCRRNLTRHAVRAAWHRARTAPQSQDCVRVRSLRHATLPAWWGRLSAPAFPAQHVRSALVLWLRRRGASPPPRICLVSRLRHASADAARLARSGYLPSPSATPSSAPAASGRRCALAPMHRPALLLRTEKRGVLPLPFPSGWMGWVSARSSLGRGVPRPSKACGMKAARRVKSYRAFSAQEARHLCHVARADSPPRCDRRREAALQGDGRAGRPAADLAVGTADRPRPASRIRGWMAHRGDKANRRWRSGEVPRTEARQRATVAKNAPEAERPLRSGMVAGAGRARTQSCDCGAARDGHANARCARGSTVGAYFATC